MKYLTTTFIQGFAKSYHLHAVDTLRFASYWLSISLHIVKHSELPETAEHAVSFKIKCHGNFIVILSGQFKMRESYSRITSLETRCKTIKMQARYKFTTIVFRCING